MTADILLSHAVGGFLLARAADGYSPATLAQYKWGLVMLLAKVDKPLSAVTIDDLRGFMAGVLARDDLGQVSKFHVWKAVHAFFKWSSAEGLSGRPDAQLTQPKYRLPEVTPFTLEDIKKLLKAVDRTAPSQGRKQGFTMSRPQALRDRAIILTLLDTGVRASELCRLQVRDVDLQGGAVTVQPFRASLKSRPRAIPLGQAARKAIWRYWAGATQKPGDPAFSTGEGKPMNKDSLLKLLSRLGERAGVTNVHPHRFRHTFAISFLRNGGDVFTLQRLLGHASLEMTRHYLALAEADDDAAHRRASPVDNWRL